MREYGLGEKKGDNVAVAWLKVRAKLPVSFLFAKSITTEIYVKQLMQRTKKS